MDGCDCILHQNGSCLTVGGEVDVAGLALHKHGIQAVQYEWESHGDNSVFVAFQTTEVRDSRLKRPHFRIHTHQPKSEIERSEHLFFPNVEDSIDNAFECTWKNTVVWTMQSA